MLSITIFIGCKKNNISLSEIKFKEDHIELGKVNISDTLKFYVVIENTSENEILQILGVEPSCDCTILSKGVSEISPKSSNSLKVYFNANKLGYQNQSIVIKSNTYPPFNNVTISATVE